MPKTDQRPYAVICLWEYVPPDRKKAGWRDARIWKLVEAFGVDDNGYCCTESKHASSGRHSYEDWISRDVWYDKATKTVHTTCPEGMDEDDADRDSIPGRVVTGWGVESGVWLAAFNPPGDKKDLYGPPWLSIEFASELKKLSNWFRFIQDGGTLYFGTARAAEKLLWPKEQPQTDV
jgi:hypothetical protein